MSRSAVSLCYRVQLVLKGFATIIVMQ